jgi:hypothetical protein
MGTAHRHRSLSVITGSWSLATRLDLDTAVRVHHERRGRERSAIGFRRADPADDGGTVGEDLD